MTLYTLLFYLIKVSLLLGMAYGLYHWLLEKEALGDLKRGYLLFSLLAAHIIPCFSLWSWEIMEAVEVVQGPLPVISENLNSGLQTAGTTFSHPAPDLGSVLLVIYLLGLGWPAWQLLRSLGIIHRQLSIGRGSREDGFFLVTLPERVVPHTFLDWVFIGPSPDFPPSLLAHEAAHAREWHSLDRLILQFLRIIFWFNPLLKYYEREMILNHELLADAAVLERGFSRPAYQRLLLDSLGANTPPPATASHLSFTSTKKRFQMMQRNEPSIHVVGKKLLRLSLAWILLFCLGSLSLNAQLAPPPPPPPAPEAPAPPPPPPLPKGKMLEANPPSADLLRKWQDSETYGVWLDGKKLNRQEVAKLRDGDVEFYMVSRLMSNAQDYGKYEYHVTLQSKKGFEQFKKLTGGIDPRSGADVPPPPPPVPAAPPAPPAPPAPVKSGGQ